jgi:hypothetical protein
LEFHISSIYELSISPSDQGNPNWRRSIIVNSSQICGIGLSVPAIGNYSLLYKSLSSLETGHLFLDSIYSFSAVADNNTFYPHPDFVARNDFPPTNGPQINLGEVRAATAIGSIGLLSIWCCV